MTFKLMLKNALRHKLRSILTIFGIAVAVSSFGLLQTVVTAWYAGVEASAANRLITRQAISFIFPLPYAYRDQIAKVPGVETASFANWFQGVYIDKNQFFARLAVDAETIFDVYPEWVVSPEEQDAFKKERSACIVGEETAKTYNLKLGDIMNIDGDIYPGQWQFVVRGIYKPRDKTVDATAMIFHWEYLNERMKQVDPDRSGYIGWYIVKIKDPGQSALISEAIDQLFKNSRAETKTETERAFQQGFVASSSAILTAMNVMSFMIVGIILLVLGNTMIMGARERTREYAVLKTLGFETNTLIKIIAGESLVIAVLGGILGYFGTLFLVNGFAVVAPKGWFPVFNLATETIVIEMISALVIGLLAAIFPIQNAIKTRIVDGLRYIG